MVPSGGEDDEEYSDCFFVKYSRFLIKFSLKQTDFMINNIDLFWGIIVNNLKASTKYYSVHVHVCTGLNKESDQASLLVLITENFKEINKIIKITII